MPGDEPASRIGNQVSGVAGFRVGFPVEMPVSLPLASEVEVVNRPVVMTVKMSESLIIRVPFGVVVAEMPFAENAPVRVAQLAQRLGQCQLCRIQTKVPPRRDHCTRHPEPDRVSPGHQSGPGRAAHREHIKLIQLHPLPSDAVDVGCGDAIRVKPDVGPPEVVGNNDDHVRLGLGFNCIHLLGHAKHGDQQQSGTKKSATHESKMHRCNHLPAPIQKQATALLAQALG